MKTKRCACGETDPQKFYPKSFYQCKACAARQSKAWFAQLKRDVQAARQAWKEKAS